VNASARELPKDLVRWIESIQPEDAIPELEAMDEIAALTTDIRRRA